MGLFRKALCKLGSHPNVRFVGDVPGYIQCQDCGRIQTFAVAERFDDIHPWIDQEKWRPDPAWIGYEAWKRERGDHA